MNAQSSFFATELPADDDADVRAAVAHFTPAVVRIRELSALHFHLTVERDRAETQEQIDSLVADIATRAERLSLSVDDLFRLINAELKTRKAGVQAPYGDYLRHLLDEATAAAGDVAQIDRELERMTVIRQRAEDRVQRSNRACAGYVAGWVQRGSTAR